MLMMLRKINSFIYKNNDLTRSVVSELKYITARFENFLQNASEKDEYGPAYYNMIHSIDIVINIKDYYRICRDYQFKDDILKHLSGNASDINDYCEEIDKVIRQLINVRKYILRPNLENYKELGIACKIVSEQILTIDSTETFPRYWKEIIVPQIEKLKKEGKVLIELIK